MKSWRKLLDNRAAIVCLVFLSLWVLLALFTFTYSWEIRPGFTLGIGTPLGSLYVLWFWKFGPQPTQEKLARARAQSGPRSAQ